MYFGGWTNEISTNHMVTIRDMTTHNNKPITQRFYHLPISQSEWPRLRFMSNSPRKLGRTFCLMFQAVASEHGKLSGRVHQYSEAYVCADHGMVLQRYEYRCCMLLWFVGLPSETESRSRNQKLRSSPAVSLAREQSYVRRSGCWWKETGDQKWFSKTKPKNWCTTFQVQRNIYIYRCKYIIIYIFIVYVPHASVYDMNIDPI